LHMVMLIVHERPGRVRFRAGSSYDARLHEDFVNCLPQKITGVSHARANPIGRCLVVRHDGSASTRAALLRLIATTPPALRPRPLEITATDRYLRATLLSAAVFAAGLVIPQAWRAALTLTVATPVLAKGVRAVLRKGLSVDVLDSAAIGITLLRRDFGTTAVTLTLLNLGNYLEATTNASSTGLLRRLLARPPEHAWIESADGSLARISTRDVPEDDIVVVGLGEAIPVDGQVVSGAASVNMASITGESVPVDREAGARVLAGGIVEAGRLRIRAVRVGDATTTARIAQFIEAALERKPVIQSSAERLAEQRILFTLGLGALTFALTLDPNRLASVFLVDYSCALKLGAPAAIRSALYWGAKAGILIKGGRGIEALAEIDTFVFDKTGTLTFGQLKVTDVVPIGAQYSQKQLLALLASLEEHATHPVADAVVREARRNALEHIHHEEVEFIVAHGLISEADRQRVVVGSRHFLEEHQKVPFAPFERISEQLEDEGKILLYAAIDGKPAGIVGLRDRSRPEAAATLSRLRSLGIQSLVMLTGDRKEKAQSLANELGLDTVFFEHGPEEKAMVVRNLQAEGCKVAFIGDGVNDVPALVAADVGIAMPRGTDLTRATADVVLLRDEIAGVVESRALAEKTVRMIRSNFRWAVALNTLLFVAAAAGRASPVFYVVAHNAVTIGTLVRVLIGLRPARSAEPVD
jgi:heavy metal translocating P-type ATPase